AHERDGDIDRHAPQPALRELAAAPRTRFRSPRLRGNRDPMAMPLIRRADAALGHAIEAAVRARHRQRLRRLGWQRALDPPDGSLWAAGEPLPRAGCELEVLVDGAQALPAIAEALKSARRFVHLTGWHVAPGFELERADSPIVLGA